MTASSTSTRTQRIVGRALRRLGPHFGQPRGLLGHAAAAVMARSNVETNRIVVTRIDPAGLDVLDIGCGPGTALRVAAQLDRPPASLTGVDRSPEMSPIARRRLRRTAPKRPTRVLTAPAEHLPFDDSTIDLAWAVNTIHHWTSPEHGIAEASRVLRPGGNLVIAERYGPPVHRHRPHGTDDAGVQAIIDTAESHGLDHKLTGIHTTSNDRVAVIVLARTTSRVAAATPRTRSTA